MYLSDLPEGVRAFLRTTEERDASASVGLTDDAVLTDLGKEHRGSAIRAWRDAAFSNPSVHVHPLHIEERVAELVLFVAIARDGRDGRDGERKLPAQFAWHIKLRDGRISSLDVFEHAFKLATPVAAFIAALNTHDLERASASFANDANVNDQQRDHWGSAEISEWLAHEMVGEKVTAFATESRETRDGRCFVEAKVTGNYDKTGLPDPLTLRFYFTCANDLITQLMILPKVVS
jgi:ketosteroid isomerase-like protein